MGVINRSSAVPLSAIFLISFAVLILEITLTKIFSVTLWYHFSYFSISIAMFGIGFGGLIVYHCQQRLKKDIKKHLYHFSILQSISIIACLLIALHLYLDIARFMFFVAYVIVTIPFVLSSMILALLFQDKARQASSLYAADLLGAALGCLACLVAITYLSAPQVILLASLASVSAAFLFDWPTIRLRTVLLFLGLGFLLFFSPDLFKIDQTKSYSEKTTPILFEKWSPLSRITVLSKYPAREHKPFWGLSSTYQKNTPFLHLWMEQDANAGTPIMFFNGDFQNVDFLKYDITALPYYLKKKARVFILGVGGGRDVLTALLFGNTNITGVDVHPVIIDLIKNKYRAYTGDIYNRKDTHIYRAEGRSFLASSKEEYDIIQIPLIDSWAATLAGAFAMTENSLYTVEAFVTYLQHLSPQGVLGITRFYFSPDNQTIKTAILARAALEKYGIKHPENNIVVIKNSSLDDLNLNATAATLLIKRSPFTQRELASIEAFAKQLKFIIVYRPRGTHNELLFEQSLTTPNLRQLMDHYYYDIRPNTDDRPFFFQMFYFSKAFDLITNKVSGQLFNYYGVLVLFILLISSSLLVIVCYIAPFYFLKKKPHTSGSWNLYFIVLGLGFMLIEIPFVQYGAVYLGNPTYGLSISLCGLLFCSGLGSLFSSRYQTPRLYPVLRWNLIFVVLFCALMPWYFQWLMTHTFGQPERLKIGLFSLALTPLAFFLGMALPAGFRLLNQRFVPHIPWFWALNGSASVLGSIIAMAISMIFGYSISLYSASFSYLLALSLLTSNMALAKKQGAAPNEG